MPIQPPERRLVTEAALNGFETRLPTSLDDVFDGHGSAAAAEAAAKAHASTLAYGTTLDATDTTVAALAADPATELGTHLTGRYETMEAAASTYVASNTVRRIITSRNVDTTLADGDVLIPLPAPTALTDFHRTPTGDAPVGWTSRWDGGVWTVTDSPQASAGKALTTGHATLGEYGLSWMDSLTSVYADVELVFRHRGAASEAIPRLLVRGSGTSEADLNGFTTYLDYRGRLCIARWWDGAFQSWYTDFPVTVGDWYTMRTRVHGDTVSVRAWRDGEPEPETWTFTREMGFPASAGTPLSEPGWAGLYVRRRNGQIDWVGMAVDGGRAPTPEVI